MLSGDFVKLVLLALLITLPPAWWELYQWLQQFAYRIDLGAGVFLIAASFLLLITLLTIGGQVVRAARRAPLESLRGE